MRRAFGAARAWVLVCRAGRWSRVRGGVWKATDDRACGAAPALLDPPPAPRGRDAPGGSGVARPSAGASRTRRTPTSDLHAQVRFDADRAPRAHRGTTE